MFIAILILLIGTIVSKSVTHLLTVIVFILFLNDAFQKKLNASYKSLNKFHKVWLGVFFIALFWNLLTPGSVFSFVEFLKSGAPLLIVPILLLYFKSRRELNILIDSFVYATILGSFYAIFNFIINFSTFSQQDVIRVSSFMIFDRWSSMAMMGLIIAVWKVLISTQRDQYIWVFWSFIIASALFLTGARGPILCSLISIISLLIMFYFKRINIKWYKVASIALIFLVMGLSHGKFRNRLFSIFSVEIRNGQMISEHQSNQGRLSMWKVYFDFFKEHPQGAGFKNIKAELEPWLNAQSTEYRAKYVLGDFSLKSAHNMYIHHLAELGWLPSLILFGLILMTIFNFFYYFYQIQDTLYLLAGSITLANLGMGVFNPYFYDYIGFSIFFFMGITLLFQKGLKDWEQTAEQ